MRYLVNMKYDGTLFYGFQIQDNERTIEGEITTTLSKIFNSDIKVVGCSRTDRGVHANNYYLHFDSDKKVDEIKLKKSLNDLTSEDIYIKNVKVVNEEFHARYSVKNKEYVYLINTLEYDPTKRNIEYQYCKPIDIETIIKASKYLIGEKDFRSFTSDNEKENTIRIINYINIENVNGIVKVYVNGNGFLKYMVRNIVGLFLDINEGKIKIEDIENIITSKDRTKLGMCAPACGLYLNRVNY